MTIAKFWPTVLGLAGIVLPASNLEARGPGKVKDWEIGPTSPEAVVIMRAEYYPADYSLVFSRNGQSGFLSRAFILAVPAMTQEPFVGRTLKPGKYRLDSVFQQGQWSSCFGERTRSFTVEPGKVYYLGTFNTREILADLQHAAIARGKTKLHAGSLAVGWKPSVEPNWTISGETEMTFLRAFLATKMPKTTAPLEALKTDEDTFSVKAGEKLIQICG